MHTYDTRNGYWPTLVLQLPCATRTHTPLQIVLFGVPSRHVNTNPRPGTYRFSLSGTSFTQLDNEIDAVGSWFLYQQLVLSLGLLVPFEIFQIAKFSLILIPQCRLSVTWTSKGALATTEQLLVVRICKLANAATWSRVHSLPRSHPQHGGTKPSVVRFGSRMFKA